MLWPVSKHKPNQSSNHKHLQHSPHTSTICPASFASVWKCLKGGDFANWKFKYLTALQAIVPNIKADICKIENTDVEVDVNTQGWGADGLKLNMALYANLVEKTEGKTFEVVRNVPDENGAEAWRRLCNRYNSRTMGKRIHLTRKCISPPRIKDLKTATLLIQRWEDSIRRLSGEYEHTVDKHLKQAVLIEMLPPNMTETVASRMDKDETYEKTRETVQLLIERQIDLHGPQPMDCSNLQFHPSQGGYGYEQKYEHEHEHHEHGGEVQGLGKGGSEAIQLPQLWSVLAIGLPSAPTRAVVKVKARNRKARAREFVGSVETQGIVRGTAQWVRVLARKAKEPTTPTSRTHLGGDKRVLP